MSVITQSARIMSIAILLGAFCLATAHAASPPNAVLKPNLNTKGAAPLAAEFDGDNSTCEGTSCNSFMWSFGDGATETGDYWHRRTSHVYTAAGNYTLTLTVTDKSGRKASTTTQVIVVPGESLTSYVSACKNDLHFQSADVPDIDCYDGDLFKPSTGIVNDYMGHRRITEQVDLVFACRWLLGSKTDRRNAVSIELMLHNRQSGNTCFFSSRTADPNIVSPTNCASSSNCAADSYWNPPAVVDGSLRCIGCHVSGPYIATPIIAPYLAKYGLLNDGHDTLSKVSLTDLSTPNKNVRYHAVSALVNGVPGAFSQWDALKQSYINPDDSGCSVGCHLVGTRSPQADIEPQQQPVLLEGPASILSQINHVGAMPPDDPSQMYSDYRSVNMDTSINDDGEYETLIGLKQRYPQFYCSNPQSMSAHVVGSDLDFDTYASVYGSKLQTFNMRDGLVCRNADQPAGTQCNDYETRYLCGGDWTKWSNKDKPTGTADNEARPPTNPCLTLSPLPNPVPEPTAIQARYFVSDGLPGSIEIVINGPNDRLAQFDTKGLICKNADQGAGQSCSNYVTTFYCPTITPVAAPTPLAKNVSSGSIGTAEKTYVVSGSINGWQASNVAGRQIYINGVPVNAGQSPLPPKTTDGKYYITFTAGGLSYASWNYW